MSDFLHNLKNVFINDDADKAENEEQVDATQLAQTADVNLVTDHENVVNVDAIYAQETALGLDTKHDIRVLDKYLAALPQTMDMATVKETLKNLLNVNSLSIDKLLADKDLRLDTLARYKSKDASESDALVAEATTKISELEKAIDELKKLISDEQKRELVQDEILKVETERLQKLTTYLS